MRKLDLHKVTRVPSLEVMERIDATAQKVVGSVVAVTKFEDFEDMQSWAERVAMDSYTVAVHLELERQDRIKDWLEGGE